MEDKIKLKTKQKTFVPKTTQEMQQNKA